MNLSKTAAGLKHRSESLGYSSGWGTPETGACKSVSHDAPFMLLDEPTNNLDSLNESGDLKIPEEERK